MDCGFGVASGHFGLELPYQTQGHFGQSVHVHPPEINARRPPPKHRCDSSSAALRHGIPAPHLSALLS
jgi:hypothetical protein